MAEPVKIAIIVEGGLVQAVMSAGVPVEFVLVDYDVSCPFADDIRRIPQDGAEPALAHVSVELAEINGPWVLRAFELADSEPGDEPDTYDAEPILARYDAGDINDEAAIAELQAAGWAEHRAYVILEQHQAS